MVRDEAIYEQVSSSDQCFPGAIHGMFTMYANTISGERFRWVITWCANLLQWPESLFDTAPADGMKRADTDMIDVNKNAECLRTNSGV